MAKNKKENPGITVKKEQDLSQWYTEVVQKAELIEYTDVSGCIIFRPYLYAMWETIKKEVDQRFKKFGIQNAYFPLFIPEKNLSKEQDHVEGFAPEVAWVTHAGNTKLAERLAVRPTSETIMYPAYAKWIRSWRDLPLRLNQWNNVVRWEFKNPVALMRTREFLWNEGHTAFATKEEAEAEREPILQIYTTVLRDLLALYASPGTKSEREKFAGAEYTCTLELFLPSGKAIQGPDFHHDGQNFAKAYNITFKDKDEKIKHVWQNTWAITTRMLGVLFMMHGDDQGLVLPPNLAPIQAVIVPIFTEENKHAILDACAKLQKNLAKTYRVHLDDRDSYTPGWKFNEWERKGVPVRIELGPKDLEKSQVVLVRRDTGKKSFLPTTKLVSTITSVFQELHANLYKRSEKLFKESVVKVGSMKELKQAIAQKKMGLAPFCNHPDCEDAIQEQTVGAKTVNIPFGMQPDKGACCVGCDKPATVLAYLAKTY